MRNKTIYGVIALALATGLWNSVRKNAAERGEDCNEYKQTDIVDIIAGPYQGAQGIVFGAMEADETCIYKVRGQRGVEMPFVQWFSPWELDVANGTY